jgi:hypothetical protein
MPEEIKVGAVTLVLGSSDAHSAGLLAATSQEAQDAGLEALRDIWKRPIRLTPAQAHALRWWHRQGNVQFTGGAIVKVRRGKTVWRFPGKAGADLPEPPSSRAVRRAVDVHLKELAKMDRGFRLYLMNAEQRGVKAKVAKGKTTEANVLALLAEGKPVHRVAKLLGITEPHVRRIRRKANIPEKGQF